ncbi:MAG: HAMP domain-containing protein, partial [Deltaproteobacteria bacterium]|nr:HAMP domain-containing protein [Deltaproteobacteria bacterium]
HQLKQKQDEAEKKVAEQTTDATKIAERAKSEVTAKVEKNTKDAVAKLESNVAGAKDFIIKTLEGSLTKTFGYGFGIALVCVVMGALFGRVMVSRILKPVSTTTDILQDIATGEGDLTCRIELKTKDEMGELANWFNIFIAKLHDIIKSIAHDAGILSDVSSNLSNISKEIFTDANSTSIKTSEVASSVEEMSCNMNSVATVMAQAAVNVSVIATASEGMTVTISEIAASSEKARVITDSALHKVKNASEKVRELTHAAEEIGKVTTSIAQISDHTKLLALNATIEAARAGEAGKGFAVVASEVKELAQQTVVATDEIRKEVGNIQKSTTGMVTEIDAVLTIIHELNQIVSAIAASIEEQSATTNEINNNISQAAEGIHGANQKVAQGAEVSSEMARSVSEVNQTASKFSSSSAQLTRGAEELNNLARLLKEMVSRFKTTPHVSAS